MAYAALLSLSQILHQTLNRDYQYLTLVEIQQIESLVEEVTFLQNYFSSQEITQYMETRIRDAAYIAEDIIESRIIDRFLTESAVRLIRFDLIEFLIVNSSKYKPIINKDGSMGFESSKHEISGVGGIEEPLWFQTINGIRQLARTHQFKAWFLDIGVLDCQEIPYPDAIWALERLATHGTKIVIIDNSFMEASDTMEMLRSLKIDTSLFEGVITSEDFRADDEWFDQDDAWFDQDAAMFSKAYKSAMVMAGVDAADHCIVVGGDFRHIKGANAAGISSIFLIDGPHDFVDIPDVRNLAARRDAHPTYVLRLFTW